jgi:hypothetical protein
LVDRLAELTFPRLSLNCILELFFSIVHAAKAPSSSILNDVAEGVEEGLAVCALDYFWGYCLGFHFFLVVELHGEL